MKITQYLISRADILIFNIGAEDRYQFLTNLINGNTSMKD